jgi:hypothetical protein
LPSAGPERIIRDVTGAPIGLHAIRIAPRLLAAAVGLAAGLGLAPASARADDAGVLRAWETDRPAFQAAGQAVRTAELDFERSGRTAPLLAALGRTRLLIVRTRRAVVAQHASTASGTGARAAVLRSLATFDRSVLTHRASTLAAARGARALAVRLRERADVQLQQAGATARQAVSLFRRAGLHPQTGG